MMVLLPMGLSVSGCVAPAARVGVEFCEHARPVYFDTAGQVDATPALVRRQVLEINETWRRLCR
jgi:hypothetical protein